MDAKSRKNADDRIVTVLWKAGMKTTVSTEIQNERDEPKYAAKLYKRFLEQEQENKQFAEKQNQSEQAVTKPVYIQESNR